MLIKINNIINNLKGDLISEQLANGFKVEQAPKGWGETRIYINSINDLKKLDKLIVLCFDEVNN